MKEFNASHLFDLYKLQDHAIGYIVMYDYTILDEEYHDRHIRVKMIEKLIEQEWALFDSNHRGLNMWNECDETVKKERIERRKSEE